MNNSHRAFLGFIFILVVLSTTVGLLKKNDSSIKKLAKTFSVVSNGKNLFSYSQNQEQMLCLNGMKVISLFWIILLHEYSIFAEGPVENLRDLESVCCKNNLITRHLLIKLLQWKNSLISSYEKSGALAVETFFVISGLLVSYNHLKKTAAKKSFNLLQFYVHRIVR